MSGKKNKTGKDVLQIGLESLIKNAEGRKIEELKNNIEVTNAVLEKLMGEKETGQRIKRRISRTDQALNELEEMFKKQGVKGLRQLTETWTKADLCAVIKEAVGRYSSMKFLS